MIEHFKLKVASRRQVTLPLRMLDLLHLSEGDFLEISVEDGRVIAGRGLKLVPTNLFTPDILDRLKEREEEMDRGDFLEVKDQKES